MKTPLSHRTPLPLLPPVLIAALLALTGCTGTRPLKGGKAVTTPKPAGGVEQTLSQSENPSAASRQAQETVKVRTYTLPAGTRIEQASFENPPAPTDIRPIPSHSSHSAPNTPALQHSSTAASFTLSAPMPVVERSETRANTELGAAQKDSAREFAAKLSSLKSIVWVGLGLFIFGIASLVWPPLKAVLGSVTTSVVITIGGIALMILPSLIVGNELLILGGVALVTGAWFLAHRHGEVRGQLRAAAPEPGVGGRHGELRGKLLAINPTIPAPPTPPNATATPLPNPASTIRR